MKKKFVIQNLETKEYWYGYYSNKKFTDNIKEARFLDDIEEAEFDMERNKELFTGLFTIVEVYQF